MLDILEHMPNISKEFGIPGKPVCHLAKSVRFGPGLHVKSDVFLYERHLRFDCPSIGLSAKIRFS
jgi:hypothetical protein